jgi:hypothetical protein
MNPYWLVQLKFLLQVGAGGRPMSGSGARLGTFNTTLETEGHPFEARIEILNPRSLQPLACPGSPPLSKGSISHKLSRR